MRSHRPDRRSMRAGLSAAVAAAFALHAGSSQAAAPVVNAGPPGAPRGVSTRVVFAGANFTADARLVAPFALEQTVAADQTNAGQLAMDITIAPATPPGIYPVRVQTPDGISDPRLFAVGAFPEVAEAEDNNTIELAQAISVPAVVNGSAAGGDLDHFRFDGTAGQRLVVEVQAARLGSGLDPVVQVLTPTGHLLASEDDTPGLLLDCRTTYTLPENGPYLIRVNDSRYQSGGNPFYRLIAGDVAYAEEVFPLGGRRGETINLTLRGGTLAEPVSVAAALPASPLVGRTAVPLEVLAPDGEARAVLAVGDWPEIVAEEPAPQQEAAATGTAAARSDRLQAVAGPAEAGNYEHSAELDTPLDVVWPATINGRMDDRGDIDRFRIAVQPGQALRFRVEAAELGSRLDGFLSVSSAAGAQLATADDLDRPPLEAGLQNDVSRDPSLDLTVPADTTELIVALRDLRRWGGVGYAYRLTIEPAVPTFSLTANQLSLNVPAGATAQLSATVTRQGYNGPIRLGLEGLPEGFVVRGGVIPDGQTEGRLTVTAPPAPMPASGQTPPTPSSQGAQQTGAAPFELVLYGEGRRGEEGFRVAATRSIVYGRDNNVATAVRRYDKLYAAVASAPAIALELPSLADNERVRLVHGYSVTVPVQAQRAEGAVGAVPLSTPLLPAGVTASAVEIADGAADGSVTFAAAAQTDQPQTVQVTTGGEPREIQVSIPAAPLGDASVVIEGRAGDTVLAAPGVTLELVRPLAVELTTTQIEVQPGGNVTVAGRVVRNAPFDQPVQVRLEGLPPGVSAVPVTVPSNQEGFTIAVVASAEAAAGDFAGLMAFGTATIGDRPYTPPATNWNLRVVAPAP